jgi:hypothetical protein
VDIFYRKYRRRNLKKVQNILAELQKPCIIALLSIETLSQDIMKNRFQHMSLIIWLLVYMPFAQATFGQAVLCLGADGHIAFENTGVDGLCHDEAHLDDVLDQGCLTVDHCGACLDLLPSLDQLSLSRQDGSLSLEDVLVDISPVSPVLPVFYPLQIPPVLSLKHLHISVSTTVLQI